MHTEQVSILCLRLEVKISELVGFLMNSIVKLVTEISSHDIIAKIRMTFLPDPKHSALTLFMLTRSVFGEEVTLQSHAKLQMKDKTQYLEFVSVPNRAPPPRIFSK